MSARPGLRLRWRPRRASTSLEGIVWVSLADIRTLDLLPSTLAAALGVDEHGARPLPATLVAALQADPPLLVLDNLEQLPSAGTLLAELLSACPGLKLLVTSRATLRISGEQVLRVQPLALPAAADVPPVADLARYAAVQLFVERARAVNVAFTLTDHNAAAVLAICRRLDGLPLAIELAASRTAVFTPQALLARLGRALPLLSGHSRDGPARLHTLRAAVAWSYELLLPREQALFRRLAVFPGSCTLDALAQLSSVLDPLPLDPLEPITALVDHSLVRAVPSDDDEPRFHMLDLVREYAQEQLEASDEDCATRLAHAAQVAQLAEVAERGVRGADQARWWIRLEAEHDSIRGALAWTTRAGADPHEAALGLRIAGALWYHWFQRGLPTEGRAWLTQALAAAPADSAARAQALLGAGTLAWRQGDYPDARAQLELSVRLWRARRDRAGLAEAFHVLGHVWFDQREYPTARRYFAASRRLYELAGDPAGAVPLLGDLGMVAYHRGQYAAARVAFERSLAGARHHGLADRIADALIRLGDLARMEQDLDRAAELYQQSLDGWQALQATPGTASALHKLAQISLARGDLVAARSGLTESLELQHRIDNRQGIAECLIALGSLAWAAGGARQAVVDFGAGAALLDAIGAPLAPADDAVYGRDRGAVQSRLGAAAWHAAWERGYALPVDVAVHTALTTARELDLSVAARPRTRRGPARPLSPREREVAALVARGSSNRAIAAALTITEKTAANHIEHIMTKLDLHTRAQVAVWAVEHLTPDTAED